MLMVAMIRWDCGFVLILLCLPIASSGWRDAGEQVQVRSKARPIAEAETLAACVSSSFLVLIHLLPHIFTTVLILQIQMCEASPVFIACMVKSLCPGMEGG